MSESEAVEWPSFCDLCEEYTSTPERCSHCGHRLRPLDRSPQVPVTAPVRSFVPFHEAVAERRGTHRALLADLASWALAEGRHVDLDVAAVVLEVLERRRTDGGIHLDRRVVTGIMWASMRNEATLAQTQLPDDYLEDLWTVLRFVAAAGRLSPDSDPEPALLEPLQCYGGLGSDGTPRPPGVEVDFFCQCSLPHDPSCPPGMVQFRIGREWEEGFELVAVGHGVPRSVDVPMSAFEPLAKLARRTRCEPGMSPYHLDQFAHLGTIPAERNVPQLWLYLFLPRRRKGWPPLALDEHGGVWLPKRHRGRRRGFYWKESDDRSAAHWCGLFSWEIDHAQREREALQRLDGDWDEEQRLRSV